MKKIIFIIMLLMLLPTTAFAHTGMESSSPKDKETITGPLTEIVLTFNTNLEKLSTFTLLDKQGQKVNVDTVAVEGKLLKGSLKTPLPNGDYTVNWKIVGEDGHVIERSFTFTVNMPEQATVNMPEQANKTPEPTSQVTEPTPSAPSGAADTKEPVETAPVQTPSNAKNTFIWIGVGALLLIGIVGFTMRKRK
ncbi:copper resistance protein CopC [Paenibacillus alginolyticus]|uniref:copper resistance CopC family protein n=1 Tax=Paenibacillus alginolyticus TaxID=59839 RepID=UPI000408EBBA|nr:copper resistance CopC family protein [Paenibacillus alginolyticus]MCY9667396.1 copper resistance protein CopC [Paenibacillus alginolyticus]